MGAAVSRAGSRGIGRPTRPRPATRAVTTFLERSTPLPGWIHVGGTAIHRWRQMQRVCPSLPCQRILINVRRQELPERRDDGSRKRGGVLQPTPTSSSNPGAIVAELEWCHSYTIVGHCDGGKIVGTVNVDMVSIGIKGITDSFLQCLHTRLVHTREFAEDRRINPTQLYARHRNQLPLFSQLVTSSGSRRLQNLVGRHPFPYMRKTPIGESKHLDS